LPCRPLADRAMLPLPFAITEALPVGQVTI
jgi:hypothetical protein